MTANPDWPDHCADRAAGHVLAASGVDVWAILDAPPPRSWRDAAALYRRHGVRSLSELVSRALGPSLSPLLARRGDIVRRGWALGICAGEVATFFGGNAVSMAEVEEAWRIDDADVIQCKLERAP
ncbi:DUF6950 family protein [Sphingomonas montanisoli]|uniref:DUF6950 domain-containing protein n=1 Tax=Sphingomonas montanisoli TaxID=2606412 RepID=A0A5D9C8Y7_9SPHN|nr:hypothetical protein [Sphingomonas montanisoli]TZG26511.1 hypothetical protein FYJ91_16455 [Sphingomonas montanisoli]